MPFFLIFTVIPLLEVIVFILVGQNIGLLNTLLLCLLTALLGGAIVRYQGLYTLAAIREALDHGRMPLNALFDGFCLFAAGVLLITPGFVADTLGLLLLLPPVREWLKTMIKRHTGWHDGTMDDGTIIEGEYTELDDF